MALSVSNLNSGLKAGRIRFIIVPPTFDQDDIITSS